VIVWTVHTKANTKPVLVSEGFTWRGFVFGPFWLLAAGAWIPGLIALALDLIIALARLGPAGAVLGFGVSWTIGLWGHDLIRWSLERRGFAMVHVVAERDEDAALSRLLDRRPDLIGDALLGEAIR
jgi:hypothetical protein